jgi:hypothetical protein
MLPATRVVEVENLGYLWIVSSTSDSHIRDVSRSALKQKNSLYLAQEFRKLSLLLKDEYPKLAKLARDVAVSYAFSPWAFIIRRRAIDFEAACKFLQECKAQKWYPLPPFLPKIIYPYRSARLLCFAISWEPILKLILWFRLPSKAATQVADGTQG